MKFQAISGPEMGGVVRGRLGMGDEEVLSRDVAWTLLTGRASLPSSVPTPPPCLLAQPLQEQGNTVCPGLSSVAPWAPEDPHPHPHLPWSICKAGQSLKWVCRK